MTMDPKWNAESAGRVGRAGDPFGVFHGYRLATWGWRVAAGIIDWWLLVLLPWSQISKLSELLANIIALTTLLANTGYMASRTGQSLGKRICGIRMLWSKQMPDGSAELTFVPLAVALLRVPLHLLDCLVVWVGWFAPIFSRGRGTFADMISHTLNWRDPRLPPARHVQGGRVEWPK